MKKMMNLLVVSSVLMAGQAIGYDITIHASQSCDSVNADDAGFFPWSPARYCNCRPGFAPNYTTNGCVSTAPATDPSMCVPSDAGSNFLPKANTREICNYCNTIVPNGTNWSSPNYGVGMCRKN